jgi:hypothetical protein
MALSWGVMGFREQGLLIHHGLAKDNPTPRRG